MSGMLSPFIKLHRARLTFDPQGVRTVHRSALATSSDAGSLAGLVANRGVELYRTIPKLIEDLEGGLPLHAFKNSVARIPTADSFQKSHFGEIIACIFAEEVLQLRRIYSKLSLLTAENANAYKMDLLLYDTATEPVSFVLGEVKSSPKHAAGGMPAGHDSSCYADIFRSLNSYSSEDETFDLGAARDRIEALPAGERDRLRDALLPYSDSPVRYAAFAIIDDSTFEEGEARVLGGRKCTKAFDVDVVGLEAYADAATDVFGRLSGVLAALRQACS